MSLKFGIKSGSGFDVNNSTEGESIENRVFRAMNNGETIQGDGAPLIYTERKMGVQPQYNIRTDRWDVAVEAMEKYSKNNTAKREEAIASREPKTEEGDGKTEPTQGTK